MLIKADQSLLLIVDIQERLAPFIHHGQAVTDHACWLVQVARRLEVPLLVTEQYPRGLGGTVAELASHLRPGEVVEKIHFSAVADGCLQSQPAFSRSQVVVAGSETHVCVLQTCLDLLGLGKQVFVVAEAVGSRRPEDKALALERLRQAGCVIVSREMLAFEWLHRAGTDLFRAISREFIR